MAMNLIGVWRSFNTVSSMAYTWSSCSHSTSHISQGEDEINFLCFKQEVSKACGEKLVICAFAVMRGGDG
jgi:hypothetical protein